MVGRGAFFMKLADSNSNGQHSELDPEKRGWGGNFKPWLHTVNITPPSCYHDLCTAEESLLTTLAVHAHR